MDPPPAWVYAILQPGRMYKAESWPDWVDQNDDEALCPIVGKPEDIDRDAALNL